MDHYAQKHRLQTERNRSVTIDVPKLPAGCQGEPRSRALQARAGRDNVGINTKYVSTTMGGNETLFGVNFADGRIKGYPATRDMFEDRKSVV